MHLLRSILISLIYMISLSLHCQSNQNEETLYIFKSIQELDISKSGFRIIKDKDRNGDDLSYGLYLPDLKDKEASAFTLALHWSSTSPTFEEFAKCLILTAYEGQDDMIIIPDARGTTWFTVDNEQLIIDIMHSVYAFLPVNKERATVTGYSDGGNMSWYISEHHPDLFSFAIPIATAYQSDGIIKLPAYAIHGEDDELFTIETTEKFIKEYEKKGAKIKWKGLKGKSHFNACTYSQALSEAIKWWKDKF